VFEQRVARHCRAVDAASLLEVHEVRLDVQPDAPAGGERNAFDESAGRALAVGAGDADHRRGELQSETLIDRSHAVQRHVDADRMQPLAVGEPVVE
jgi:hypothetical protein